MKQIPLQIYDHDTSRMRLLQKQEDLFFVDEDDIWTPATLSVLQERWNWLVLLQTEKKEIVGYIEGSLNDPVHGDIHLGYVELHPQYRGMGLCQPMLSFMFAQILARQKRHKEWRKPIVLFNALAQVNVMFEQRGIMDLGLNVLIQKRNRKSYTTFNCYNMYFFNGDYNE